MCRVNGPVNRGDGTSAPYATVTFNSMVAQSVQGHTVQPLVVSRDTDRTGLLIAVSLVQGLSMQVLVTDGGVTYPAATVLIPFLSAATFSQILTMPSPGNGAGPSEGLPEAPTDGRIYLRHGSTQTWVPK